jgi:[lysine-biosynthesis-protein LysW]--L-2-aminoadipate ligase
VKIAILCSRVRLEEKLLLAAFDARGVQVEPEDVRTLAPDVSNATLESFDADLVRCLSDTRAFDLTRWLERADVPTINPHRAIAACGDKLLMSLALAEAGLPTPRTVFGFERDRMVEAIEETIGYPAVLKPLHGSWGRLLARLGDRFAAEALLEHKATLGGVAHSVFYAQEYIDKPGRDIRSMVIGDEVPYAIWRTSDHWITNTATGGRTSVCPVTDEIRDLSLRAARAVGGEVIAVDLLERAGGDLLVNEVNHTPEFHGSVRVVDVDIPGTIADYVIEKAKERA